MNKRSKQRINLLKFFETKPITGYEQLTTNKLNKLKSLYDKELYDLKDISRSSSTYTLGKKRYLKNKSHIISDIFNSNQPEYGHNNIKIKYDHIYKHKIIPNLNGFTRKYFDPQGYLFIREEYANPNNNSIKKWFEAILYAIKYSEFRFSANRSSVKIRLFKTSLHKLIDADDSEEYIWVNLPLRKLAIDNDHSLNMFIADVINKNKAGAMLGSDIAIAYPNIDTTIFQIYTINVSGGSDVPVIELDSNCNHKTEQINNFTCISPRSSSNNCLIENFRYITKNKILTSISIRKQLNIPKDILLNNTHIPLLEKHFNTNIVVISGRDDNGNLNVIYGDPKKAKFWFMLNNNHFSIVVRELSKINLSAPKNVERVYYSKTQLYLGYDYETIYNNKNVLIPYSVDCILYKLVKNEPVIINTFFASGLDCNDKFINQLKLWNSPKFEIVMFAYNSARFDHFLLAEALSKNNLLSSNSLFIAKGSILQIKFLSYVCMDLCKFTLMKLSDACEGFGCKLNKTPFDHNIPQRHYNNGTFDEYLKDNISDIYKYNHMDVEAMGELFFKVRKAANLLLGKDLTKFMTLNQMCYKKFRDLTTVNVCPPPNDIEAFNFIKDAQIAGRSEIFKKGFTDVEIQSLDVKSLYPFVMLMCQYPIGKEIKTDKYVPGKLGIYNVDILSQPKLNIIPLRTKDEPLNWKHGGVINCRLCTVDIDTLLEFGSNIIIKDGYYWEESSSDVFREYIGPIKDEKTRQDILSKNNDSEYNPAMRSFSKSCLNNLSGKVNQGLYDTDTKLCHDLNQITSFTNTHVDCNICPLAGSRSVFISGTKTNFKYGTNNAKPCQLGVYIYAYARQHMYRSILSKVDSKTAMDTDSCHMPVKDIIKLIQEKGFGNFFMGDEFGDFEKELKFFTKRCYYLDPKCYALFSGLCNLDKNNRCKMAFDPKNKCCKMRFKGIGPGDKILDISIDQFNRLSENDKLESFINMNCALSEQLYVDLNNNKTVYIVSSLLIRNIAVDNIAQLKHVFTIKSIKSGEIRYH